MMMLTISGSLQSRSSNTALVRAAAAVAPSGCTVSVSPSVGDLPHFNPELDVEGTPASVVDFRTRVRGADALLIATPEYAHGVPGVLKNALDWIVGSGDLMGKPLAVLSASPNRTGGMRAQLALIPTLLVMDAVVVAQLTVQVLRKDLDDRGGIADPAILGRLAAVVDTLARAAGFPLS